MYQIFSKFGYRKRQLEWLPILLVRVCLGIFFIFSGFFKMFQTKQHKALLETLRKVYFPFPEFNAYFIPFLQCVGGVLILLGLLCTLASFMLFVIMIVALITERAASVAHHGGLIAFENFLYLPEVLYALLFLWLFFSGPGKMSFDFLYGKKRRHPTY